MYSREVRVHWDPEAQVWWAESDDVPGLVAEAATEKDMKTELRQLVPELLIENNVDVPGGRFRLHMIMDQSEELALA